GSGSPQRCAGEGADPVGPREGQSGHGRFQPGTGSAGQEAGLRAPEAAGRRPETAGGRLERAFAGQRPGRPVVHRADCDRSKDAKLLTVVDLSALEVQVNVPESFARDLAAGMPAAISGNGKDWKGAVSAISPEVVNGEVVARVRFEGSKPEYLRQNQRLSVRIVLDKRDNVLTVARGSFVDES